MLERAGGSVKVVWTETAILSRLGKSRTLASTATDSDGGRRRQGLRGPMTTMLRKIDRDVKRFRQIVRGVIKKEFRKYLTQGELIGRQGKHVVSIPLPQIEIPRFRFGSKEAGGVGQGDGEAGEGVEGAPGTEPGDHILEAEVSLDELAAILGEELELPRILPRGRRSVPVEKVKYSNIRRVGPESLRHFKRTFREALKRQVALGLYNPGNPLIVPIREDRRYRSWHVREVPESNAVIILCMDVSGSMGDQQKEIVRVASFWIDTWLRSQYKNLENVYVVHEAFAKEVDQHTFYHLRESGGTKISTAYELINAAIDSRFSPDSWNVYLFHFSDGENGDSRDTDQCMELLRKELLPKLNLFCFGQVRSSYGGGRFKNDIEDAFPGEGKVVTSEIRDKDEIYDAIKRFLGKGL
jgi:uncharacterized sporulation protein YeaH/YhbH (DUF444 family)